QGTSAVPCVHLARALFEAGRGATAFAVLCAGLGAAEPAWRDTQLRTLAEPWRRANLDVPMDRTTKAKEADPVKLARWAIACEPTNADAHCELGLALAQQGNVIQALHHLELGARDRSTQLLTYKLSRSGHAAAQLVADYAARSITP